MKIAVLITVFNRIEKTLLCLKSLFGVEREGIDIDFKVFITTQIGLNIYRFHYIIM